MLEYTEQDGEIYVSESEESIREKRKLRYEYFLKASGIPQFYHNINFEDYEGDRENKEYLHLLHYAKNCHKKEFDHIHLFIYGLHSTQKSALAYNIGKEAIKNGLKVKSILAGTLIDKLMKLQGFNYIEEIYQEVKDLKSCDLLIIDDFGDIDKAMHWNGANKNLIISEWDRFLREVLASNTKIVTTSNYDKNNIGQHFGKSILELIDRNFFPVHLIESIKATRQYNVAKVFENIYNEDIKRRG
jgi:DNA replication protein DnaC